MEQYYVWWPWLTSKRVARVCQHQLSFLFYARRKYSAYLLLKDGWLDGWMSHAGIVSKRLKISSNFFLGLIALSLWFSNTALWLRNSNGKGRLSLGWTSKFSVWKHSTTQRPTDTFSPSATIRLYGSQPVAVIFIPPDYIESRRFLSISLTSLFYKLAR